MQTAFGIDSISFSTDVQGEGGAGIPLPTQVVLTVAFRVFNIGPSHVAGIVVTTDFWVTTHVVPAVFQGFGAGFESWQAVFSVDDAGPVSYEFVVFCDDFGGENQVPRIWNTNGGNRFRTTGG